MALLMFMEEIKWSIMFVLLFMKGVLLRFILIHKDQDLFNEVPIHGHETQSKLSFMIFVFAFL